MKAVNREEISDTFAQASLVCSVSFWLGTGLNLLQAILKLPGWGWLARRPAWLWPLLAAVGLLLALVATVLGSKSWRVTLSVALAGFLLTLYVMGWSR